MHAPIHITTASAYAAVIARLKLDARSMTAVQSSRRNGRKCYTADHSEIRPPLAGVAARFRYEITAYPSVNGGSRISVRISHLRRQDFLLGVGGKTSMMIVGRGRMH